MPDKKTEEHGLWSKTRVTQLVETYRFPLLYFATGFIGNLTDAEDVVEDALVKLLVKKPRLKDETAVKTYLFTTVKHLSVDYLRKLQRKRKQQTELFRLSEKDVERIEERICRTETQRELAAALHTLPSDARETLYLQYFEGLPPREIAKITGKSIKQVYNLTARAKKSLAETLQKESFDNEN